MWLYSSPLNIMAASVVSLLGLTWGATGRNPLAQFRSAILWLWREPRFMLGLMSVSAVLAVNHIETRWEHTLQNPWDFTPQVAQFGTELLLWLQRLEWAPATHFLTYVYVILFPLFGLTSMIVYAARRDWDSLRRLFLAFGVNYLTALPFYVLIPVREAWAGGAGVRFLIPTVFPAFEAQYRPLSGLDNSFPSLHTSLALTYALVAWRSGYRRLALVLTGGAGLVMLSTLYLGVHWVPDMFAGAALSLLAAGYVPVLAPRAATAPNQGYFGWKGY